MLKLKLFGSLELSGPDGRIALSSAKLCAFLAYLALAPRPVPRDEITTLLWGSHFEDRARQNFRQALTRLRKLVGQEALVAGVKLARIRRGQRSVDPHRIDVLIDGMRLAGLRED
jgi:DNA-binding SARP family transcriptional activator